MTPWMIANGLLGVGNSIVLDRSEFVSLRRRCDRILVEEGVETTTEDLTGAQVRPRTGVAVAEMNVRTKSGHIRSGGVMMTVEGTDTVVEARNADTEVVTEVLTGVGIVRGKGSKYFIQMLLFGLN